MAYQPTTRFGLALAATAFAFMAAGASTAGEAAKPITKTVDATLEWGPCPAIFPTGCQIAVLQGDPSKPNADVFLRVPSGYTIPAHTHTSAERMVLVQGELSVRYQGAAAEKLSVGEYAYGPAKLPHIATCGSKGPCTLFIAFEGPVDAHAFEGSLD